MLKLYSYLIKLSIEFSYKFFLRPSANLPEPALSSRIDNRTPEQYNEKS